MVLRENKTQKRAAGAKKNWFLNKSELMIFFWKIKNISKKKMGNPGTLMIFFSKIKNISKKKIGNP